MNFERVVRLLLAVMLLGGIFGCGGKKNIEPEPTPVAFVEPEPMPEPVEEEVVEEVDADRYEVVSGDTLWDISGKEDIYGDHFQWPLIFKANRDQIEDPDLIEIGQDLAISRDFTAEEIEMAIENAKRTPRYVPHTQPRRRLPVEY